MLGLESEPETVELPTHSVHLGVHPIGIDPVEIRRFTELPEVQDELASLGDRYSGKKIVLGVDRLDYTKGIPGKLLAFEEFLRLNPRWRTRVVLIQVAAPTRTQVKEYQELKREVDELVGRINGRYGSFNHTPIVYINQTVARTRLTALYQAADVAFITPLRDGMNLVALEYVAARGDRSGTLVLSEFAGAASCLAGARLVNPHDVSDMAEVLAEALVDSESTGEAFQQMRDFVHGNTSAAWADRFLARLGTVHEEQRRGALRLDLSEVPVPGVPDVARWLFILDYEGTLRPDVTTPSEAAPTTRLCELLKRLASVAVVYVVAGRPEELLEHWLGDIPIGLVCEDGLAIKEPRGQWPATPAVDRAVLDGVVEPVLSDFVEHTPGSKIERREASVAWNYRAADPKLGSLRAKELYARLEDILRGLPYMVLAVSRVIEVRHVQMTKVSAANKLLQRHAETEVVFCAGNDRYDEATFDILLRSGRAQVLTCYVGGRDTLAQYYVESPEELLTQLEKLVAAWPLRRDVAMGPPVAGTPGGRENRDRSAATPRHVVTQ